MYKKRLLITEDEKKYIQGLYGLLQEQETLPGETLKVEFGDQYANGMYLIKDKEVFKKILNSKLTPFRERNPGVPLTIKVLGGESATTNYDKELNDGKAKEDFYLAKMRRNEMVNFLKDYFATSTIEPKPIVDDSPNEENVNVFRKGLTQKDRFVDVLITAQAPDTCLVGLKIEVIYQKDGWSETFPCRGRKVFDEKLGKEVTKGHICDEAIFNVLLNNVNIGQVNLNNKVDGGSRVGVVEVTKEQAIAIAKKGGNTVVLSLQCVLENCHSDVAEVRISNKEGVIYHSCTPTLQQRGDTGINDLLVLDKCGTKIIQKSTKRVTSSGEMKVEQQYGSAYWNAVEKTGRIKKLEDGSYEVVSDKLMNPATKKTFKMGEIIPKPSF